jgi:hypothetical protein
VYVAFFLAAPDDPLFLQVKEARRSVLEQFTGRARVKYNGQRVVVGQRLMQSASDIFLGWSRGRRDHSSRTSAPTCVPPTIDRTMVRFGVAAIGAFVHGDVRAADRSLVRAVERDDSWRPAWTTRR